MRNWITCMLLLLTLNYVHSRSTVADDDSGDSDSAIDTNEIFPEKPRKPRKELKPGKPTSPNAIPGSTGPGNKPGGKIYNGPVGQGFDLNGLKLLTDELKATGATIFENLPSKCVKPLPKPSSGTTTKDSSFYDSTESLYSSIATTTNVDASLKGTYTLGASVSAVTKNLAMSSEDVSGLSLNLQTREGARALAQDCINDKPLNPNFVEDFKTLPAKIREPWKTESWRPYSVFLKTYGSHIVREITFGASVYQYVFAKSNKKLTQREFTVKACISLAGPSQAGEFGVNACSGISKEEKETASQFQTVENTVIRGGSAETKAKLVNSVTPELVTQFLQEGSKLESPIEYSFYPIWDVLDIRFGRTEHAPKVLNLLQFYKGFLSFECDHQISHNGKVDIQRFELIPNGRPETPVYQCTLGPESCHDNNDCHYEHAFWCSCAGESCVRYKDQHLTSGTTKKVAFMETARRQWGWHGCQRHIFTCRCDNPGTRREVSWSGRSALDDLLKEEFRGPSNSTSLEWNSEP